MRPRALFNRKGRFTQLRATLWTQPYSELMADGKWIDGLQADLPPEEAARLVLTARFAVVRDYLPRALEHSEDVENVHQLRVGTRRADAAVKIFRSCLPESAFKKARKRLRQLRRAAGAARDWDVFALELAERQDGRPEKERAALDHLLGYSLGRRALAQADLAEVGHEEYRHFGTFMTRTVAAIGPPDDASHPKTLVQLARPTLAELRDDLQDSAAADLTDYEMLHRVRIAGKRLRYAMEVFADCFDSPFRDELYPRVEDMQEILGRANDSHVAVGRLTEMRDRLKKAWPKEWTRLRPGVEGLLRYHQRRLPQEKRRFLAWWQKWLRDGEALFDSCLVY